MVWEKGESGNPNGRPRKALNMLSKKIGVEFNVTLSGQDKYRILESMLEMSINELKSIGTDPRAPAFMAIIARGIVTDFSKGTTSTLDGLMDRFFGKPKMQEEVEEQKEEKEFQYEHPEVILKLIEKVGDLSFSDLKEIANLETGAYIDYEELEGKNDK